MRNKKDISLNEGWLSFYTQQPFQIRFYDWHKYVSESIQQVIKIDFTSEGDKSN